MEFIIKNGKLITDSPQGLPELDNFLGALEKSCGADNSFANKFSQLLLAVQEQNLSTVVVRIESHFLPKAGSGKAADPFSGGSLVHEFTISGEGKKP